MSAEQPGLGFIGVGAMGEPMALNLLRAGFPLVFCTSREGAAATLREAGGQQLADANAVAAACDILLTCLPADAEIEAVLLSPDSAIDRLHAGGTIIELSTASPETMRRLGERAGERDIAVLDAPVSGGTSGARNATLSIMVGGSASDLAACRPIFEALGKQIYHVGPLGMGKVFKLCNQYLAAANTALVGEALTLGANAGADLELLVNVIAASSGASKSLAGAAETLMADEPLPASFRLDLMRKDLGLALALGAATKTPLATGAVAYQLYGAASASGFGDRNYPEVGTLVAQMAGVRLSQREQE